MQRWIRKYWLDAHIFFNQDNNQEDTTVCEDWRRMSVLQHAKSEAVLEGKEMKIIELVPSSLTDLFMDVQGRNVRHLWVARNEQLRRLETFGIQTSSEKPSYFTCKRSLKIAKNWLTLISLHSFARTSCYHEACHFHYSTAEQVLIVSRLTRLNRVLDSDHICDFTRHPSSVWATIFWHHGKVCGHLNS